MITSAHTKLDFLLYFALADDLLPELWRLRYEVYFALLAWSWHNKEGTWKYYVATEIGNE